MKNRKLSEHFEQIYMRYNDFQKYAGLADPEIVSSKQFNKSIDHVARTFQKSDSHRLFFSKAGFDYEDVRNVALIFGVTFVGRQAFNEEDPRNFYLMIRFVGQRMSRFMQWVSRKFSSDEVSVLNIHQDKTPNDSHHKYTLTEGSLSYNDWLHATGADDMMSPREHYECLKQDMDEVSARLQNPDLTDEERERAAHDLGRLDEERRSVLREVKAKSMASNNYTRELKERFKADPMKHADRLLYLATSKSVSHDVRKAARAACKRMGLDYKTWLKGQLEVGAADTADFSY